MTELFGVALGGGSGGGTLGVYEGTTKVVPPDGTVE